MAFNFVPMKSKPRSEADMDNYENNAPAIALWSGVGLLTIMLLSVNESRTYYGFFSAHVAHGIAVVLTIVSILGIGWFFMNALQIAAENQAKIDNKAISGNIDDPKQYYIMAGVLFIFILFVSGIGGIGTIKAFVGQDGEIKDLSHLQDRLNKSYAAADAAYSQQVQGVAATEAETTIKGQIEQSIRTFDAQIGSTWGAAKKALLSQKTTKVGALQNALLSMQQKNIDETKSTKAEAEKIRQESRKQAYAIFISDQADATHKNSVTEKSNEMYNWILNISSPMITLLLLSLATYATIKKTQLEAECGIFSMTEIANTGDDEIGEKTIGGIIVFVLTDIPITLIRSTLIRIYNWWLNAYGKNQKKNKFGGK